MAYQIDFNRPEAIHFIGIGGISMSGLAEILLQRGFLVSGSDLKETSLTKRLEEKGVVLYYGQQASNIKEHVTVVVYTAAVHEDNKEWQAAKEKQVHVLTRAQLLGQMMRNYDNSIAVAGTHGKTTTTSMLSQVLLEAQLDPTILVGGILNAIGGNIRVGGEGLFVTEACEYTNSFLSFFPTIEIILNIEEDHLDFFHNLEEIQHSFHEFGKRLPEDGVLIINSDIENLELVTRGLSCRVITVGKCEGSHYQAEEITYDTYARPSFWLVKNGKRVCEISLGVCGEHNVYNALAVIAASDQLFIPMEQIQEGLKRFTGTNRRFEKKGEVGGVTILDDYAHHPGEVLATLKTARNYPHKNIWCVFQPHTYTRTKAFLQEFADSLSLADQVILADIYAARETDTLGISSKELADKIREKGTPVSYFSSFDEIETFILENCTNGDLLITMGAGDIVKVGEKLLGR